MPSEDQQILEVLTEYSQDVRRFTESVLDATDDHFQWVAGYIKRSVPEGWLPEYARPAPPPPPPVSTALLDRVQQWVSRNRALTAALVAFFGTGGYLLWHRTIGSRKKRRARRASNGARKEVVVIAGPPSSPVVKSLSLDFERRGFIIYIVCSDMEEEERVHDDGRADIRPLHLDIADTFGTMEAIARFNEMLRRPHVAFAGATPHNLELRGLVLVPDLVFPTGPVETVGPELWADALNAKVLKTIAVTHTFLPILGAFKARVVMLTPGIVSSLRIPFQSVEATVVNALEGFTASLRGELGTLGIEVCQFKLGTFDYATSEGGKAAREHKVAGPSTRVWPETTRRLYASNFVTQSRVAFDKGLLGGSRSYGGSPLRELHIAVFDALTQRRPRRVWHVGRGSATYGLVGDWVPAGLVGWMMGVQRVSLSPAAETPRLEDSVQMWEQVEEEEDDEA